MATVCALHLFQDSQKKAAHNLDQVEAGRLRDPILLGSGSRSASEHQNILRQLSNLRCYENVQWNENDFSVEFSVLLLAS